MAQLYGPHQGNPKESDANYENDGMREGIARQKGKLPNELPSDFDGFTRGVMGLRTF